MGFSFDVAAAVQRFARPKRLAVSTVAALAVTALAPPAGAVEPVDPGYATPLDLGFSGGEGGHFGVLPYMNYPSTPSTLTLRQLPSEPTWTDGACRRNADGTPVGTGVAELSTQALIFGLATTFRVTRAGTTWYYLHLERDSRDPGLPDVCSVPRALTVKATRTKLDVRADEGAVGTPRKTYVSQQSLGAYHAFRVPGDVNLSVNGTPIGTVSVPMWEDWSLADTGGVWTPGTALGTWSPMREGHVTWTPQQAGTFKVIASHAGNELAHPAQSTILVDIGKHPTKIRAIEMPKTPIKRGKAATVKVSLTGAKYTKGGKVTLLAGSQILKTGKVSGGVAKLKIPARTTKRLPKGKVRVIAEFRGTKNAETAMSKKAVKVR